MFIRIFLLYFVELAPYLSYCYHTIIEKEPSTIHFFLIRAPANRNESEFQSFCIRACSFTDSGQCDCGISKANLLFSFLTMSMNDNENTLFDHNIQIEITIYKHF